ncbi:MAG TPA: DUF2065 domain-containing protein [Rhodospirillaceae bacterium]|nr:MAG: hypothetical protein A2018_07520 [Alphaproteobacteria bacterium GWF2_58_20]HAU28702.1 DUF2065 domain-containing protein [Rhodospirillaceae bacterium]
MTDLLVAVGLVFVLEGASYALFPRAIQKAMAAAMALPPERLRMGGLVAAVVGALMIWLLRR